MSSLERRIRELERWTPQALGLLVVDIVGGLPGVAIAHVHGQVYRPGEGEDAAAFRARVIGLAKAQRAASIRFGGMPLPDSLRIANAEAPQ
jgi:hypothetical protein